MNRCPWCKTPFRLTAAAPRPTNVQWTDGYSLGSLDNEPALRCRTCERCFFGGDGPTDLLRRGEKMSEVDTVTQAEALHAAIVQPPGWAREQEVRLRLLAWQADNEPLRRKYAPPAPWGVVVLGCVLSLGILLLGYWLHWHSGERWHEVGTILIRIGAELVATILTCLPLAALCWIVEELEYRRRLKECEQPDPNQRFFLNLQALYPLLRSEEPKERLLKAEAARQLGRFEDALTLVAEPSAVGSGPVGAKIRQLAAEGNRLLHPV